MKYFFILLLTLSFLSIAKANEQNIPYMEGIPVLNGFSVIHDDILIFDKPEGQIIEVSIWCDNNCPSGHDAYLKYRKIFQNLGWNADDTMGFHKGKRSVFMELQKLSKEDPSLIIVFHSKG